MDIKFLLKTILSTAIVAFSTTSCVQDDEWSTPPIACHNKFDAANISMSDFVAQAPSSGYVLIQTDQIFDAYVVSSDEQGNFYKTLSFQDKTSNPTVGLQIEIDKTSNYIDMPVGSYIRINAKGLRLGTDRGTIKLGAVDPIYAIGRVPSSLVSRYISGVCNGNQLDIQTITPTALNSLAEAKQAMYINTLVTVPTVQFSLADVYPEANRKRYIDYDAANVGVDTDRTIEDNLGNSTIIRTSGFFRQGDQLLAKGSGSMTFVVSRYNTTWQMIIRSLDDVKLEGTRFDSTPPKGGTAIAYSGAFTENFESYATSPANLEVFPKYLNDPLFGNRYWQLKTFGGNKYIQLSANAGSGNYHTFFMVPVDFTAANAMSFKVNYGFYNGSPLKVYYTTDYSGDITTATLTEITSSFTFPTSPTSGYGVLTSAGTYNIPASVTGNGYFVFKYEGNSSGITTTAQIDDITVN